MFETQEPTGEKQDMRAADIRHRCYLLTGDLRRASLVGELWPEAQRDPAAETERSRSVCLSRKDRISTPALTLQARECGVSKLSVVDRVSH